MSLATERAARAPAADEARAVLVEQPGLQTTVQELPGRTGMWSVGVPPSGPWDTRTARLVNTAVGNPPSAALLECVMRGPRLRLDAPTWVCVGGAARAATLDGEPLTPGVPTLAAAGSVLDVGRLPGPGMRGYVALGGGIDVPAVLGSRATFLLGALGGVQGRALVAGDALPLGAAAGEARSVASALPELRTAWELRVVLGPHGAPDHLTAEGVAELLAATWTVDHRADRTGIRLLGPRPRWARADGGEAGLHPSNIHDSAYPVGGVMLSGDTLVVVGPDGPSLGGFVVPFVVCDDDQWALGQLRPGDTVRLISARTNRPVPLGAQPARDAAPALSIRCAGDRHLLLEAGPAALDLRVRLWIHLLAQRLQAVEPGATSEAVEGVRSLLLRAAPGYDLDTLARLLLELADGLGDPDDVELPVRDVVLPVALDHPLAHEAMTRYAAQVRPDAPWCPDNVEFIRRVNGLAAREDVFDVFLAATYLVIGLGDVYLGAPVAVPLDPRHRMVTTKYDPARTWTPQNAVGIGGVYLCVYGMEGPGGYQLLGRTVPVWRHVAGQDEPPWLLRPFDRLRFRPVSAEELADLRADIAAGRADLDTTPATFALAEVRALEAAHADEAAAFTARRDAALAAERARWGR